MSETFPHIQDFEKELRAQAAGNGVDPEKDIHVNVVSSQVDKFTLSLSLKIDGKKESMSVKGPDPKAIKVEMSEDLDERYQRDIEEDKSGAKITAAIDDILRTVESSNFTNLDKTLELPSLMRRYGFMRICKNCQGEGEHICGACQGEGETVCSKCMGSKQLPCPDCGGTGQIETTATNKKTEKNDKGETVNHVETEKVVMQCATCKGSGNIQCGFCGGTGKIICETCGGAKSVKCVSCDATGKITDITLFKGTVKLTPTLETDETKNKITLSSLSKLLSQKKIQLSRNTTEPEKILYEGTYPTGEIEISFKDKKQHAQIEGYDPKIDGLKPFMDGFVKAQLGKLSKAVKGKSSLIMAVMGVMNYRVFQDAAEFVNTHREGKAHIALHEKYNYMFSLAACQAMTKGMRVSLQNLAKSARWYGLGTIILFNIIFMTIYTLTAWGDTITLRSGFINVLDFIVFFGLIGANIKLVGFVSNITVARLLRQSNSSQSLKVPIGKETYIISGIAAAVIYIIAINMTPHPPIWVIRMF